ncbi:hypothetical protein PILCRDRAFT_343443 [Piloderma croceum F 1598]|uniref:Uncharacterized protein n=1 Tax=Piloderma croceum (strain F 1598) TaxID=765440 RepID=A0A0C3G535_PILCF|nr:hypothetical protein PILCRDRAFT_343443 [Piloderma croceum F 1598]
MSNGFFPLFFRFMPSGPSSMSYAVGLPLMSFMKQSLVLSLAPCHSFHRPYAPSLVATYIHTHFLPKARHLSSPLAATTYPTYLHSFRTVQCSICSTSFCPSHHPHTHPTHYPIRS